MPCLDPAADAGHALAAPKIVDSGARSNYTIGAVLSTKPRYGRIVGNVSG